MQANINWYNSEQSVGIIKQHDLNKSLNELELVSSLKKQFEHMGANDPNGVTTLDPRGIVLAGFS